MRKTEMVNIGSIKMDRFPLNPATLNLIKYLEQGGKVPPIKISSLGTGQYLIKDGRHRITAYKLLGKDYIKATFSPKPLQFVNLSN